jgi:hypothetical protein
MAPSSTIQRRVVADAVAGRPERTEVTVVVDVPLAPGGTTVLDVRGPAVGLESLQLRALPGGAGSIDSGNGRRDGAPSGYPQPTSYRPD